ncbi:hypothetical protein [Dietzia alimentaria]|uniref:hypothetical protein n=1 Tax=Dietzia alimentaria TaxID=665550 RepID=UPI00029A81E8|nr:hypothetical protein [Dietzia alimentaria]
MSAIPIVTKHGPKTFHVAETVRGGQVVEARTGGKIGVAAEDSAKVLGVSIGDAAPAASAALPDDAFGNPVVSAVAVPEYTGVAYSGIEVKCVFSAAATFGEAVVSAGDGKVKPAGASPTGRIVGYVTEPAGVSAANKSGLVRTL